MGKSSIDSYQFGEGNLIIKLNYSTLTVFRQGPTFIYYSLFPIGDAADGRNPAPLGMSKTMQIKG